MANSSERPVLYAILGLSRAGRILHGTLILVGGLLFVGWFALMPRLRFSDEDERLFRAARHGDVAGVEQSLAAGAHVDAAGPIDGRTALFRAAVFGYADVVSTLLTRGANPAARGNDGRTALEVVLAARADEKDPSVARGLDAVATVLRQAEPQR